MVINSQKISILVEIHLDMQDTNQDLLKRYCRDLGYAYSWSHRWESKYTMSFWEKNSERPHWKLPPAHVAALTSVYFPGQKRKKKKRSGFQYHHSGNSCPTDSFFKWTVTAYLNVRICGKGQGVFSQFQNSGTDKIQQINRLRQLFVWQLKFLLPQKNKHWNYDSKNST